MGEFPTNIFYFGESEGKGSGMRKKDGSKRVMKRRESGRKEEG